MALRTSDKLFLASAFGATCLVGGFVGPEGISSGFNAIASLATATGAALGTKLGIHVAENYTGDKDENPFGGIYRGAIGLILGAALLGTTANIITHKMTDDKDAATPVQPYQTPAL